MQKAWDRRAQQAQRVGSPPNSRTMLVENLDILAFAAGQVRDEITRIRCYHRSFRNCFSLIENLTFSRSF